MQEAVQKLSKIPYGLKQGLGGKKYSFEKLPSIPENKGEYAEFISLMDTCTRQSTLKLPEKTCSAIGFSDSIKKCVKDNSDLNFLFNRIEASLTNANREIRDSQNKEKVKRDASELFR